MMGNTQTSTLTPADVAGLRSSFINDELIKQANIYRVDEQEGSEIVVQKRANGRSFSGIVFEYRNPGDPYPCKKRLRRDKPDMERVGGELKEKGKYLSPAGERQRFYWPPNTLKSSLKDSSIPVVFVEGEKKALALSRWAEIAGVRLVVIGLAGVWSFKGTIAKNVKGLLPDFEWLTWQGREVYILFDSNVLTNLQVAGARSALAHELNRMKAEVFTIDLPKECDVNGVDDYLGAIEQRDGLESAIEAGHRLFASKKPAKIAKVNQSEQILGFASDIEVFHTPDQECYAFLPVDGHMETRRLSEKACRMRLAQKFFESEGKPPGSQAVQDAIDVLKGQALFEGKEIEVHLGVAKHDGCIYVDLRNDAWQIIKIDTSGYSIIESKDAPVRFRRSKGMRALPTPSGKGDISLLRRFLNIRDGGDECDGCDGGFLLILSWLVTCFRPDMPFPILVITGPPGTAKSTTAKVLKELTDPSVPSHRSCPRDVQDLMIAANNGWVNSYDNISNIPDWLSDALCRIATGGGFSTRTLYENDEETLFDAKRPILLNGIGNFASRSDLIDRSVTVQLSPITKEARQSERQFWAEFDEHRTAIFTGLVMAVSAALRKIDSVLLSESPRMADFAEWGTAAEVALGFPEGSFMLAYNRNRDASHSFVLEGSTLAEVLQELCEATKPDNREILLKDFLEEIRKQADISPDNPRTKRKDFPKTSRGLRGELQRLDPNLREVGIFVEFLGKTGPSARKGASVRLDYIGESPSQPSQPSQINQSSINTETSECDVPCDVLCDVKQKPIKSRCDCGAYDVINLPCPNCGQIIEDYAEVKA